MIKVYIDGASFGNPGRVGIGYLIYRNDNLVKKESIYLGVQTNNFAEYMALIFSLTDVLTMKETECQVFTDSKLLCEQINGRYKVKNNNIYPLFVLAKKIISQFKNFTITHVYRENNQEADKLSKKAVGF
jgi:ribonuclease HI